VHELKSKPINLQTKDTNLHIS